MKKEIISCEKETQNVIMLRDRLAEYTKKFVHIQEACVYFEVDDKLYGIDKITLDIGRDILFVWQDHCDYTFEEKGSSVKENVLYKSPSFKTTLMDNESILELYTLLDMEIKLKQE